MRRRRSAGVDAPCPSRVHSHHNRLLANEPAASPAAALHSDALRGARTLGYELSAVNAG